MTDPDVRLTCNHKGRYELRCLACGARLYSWPGDLGRQQVLRISEVVLAHYCKSAADLIEAATP